MSKVKKVLAFDFGASSGRAMIGSFDGSKIGLEEIHRFSNDSVFLNGTLYWDTLRQLFEIKQGILKCRRIGGADSIGIDTWGVDFGLIDAKGYLLESHVHYRDTRTKGMIDEAARVVSKQDIYAATGIQFNDYNTLYQLLAILKKRPELLERADKLLFTPDLFNYFLTGEAHTEYTIASTSQLLKAGSMEWNRELIAKFGLPERLFTPILAPGTQTGFLSDSLCEELGTAKIPVIAVTSHDTASAVVSVPSADKRFAFLSSGTWSLLGTELSSPIINEKSLENGFTNEGGYNGTTRFLRNIVGLWLIQESRRQWQREGQEVSFNDLEHDAVSAQPFRSFIDPNAPELMVPGDLPNRIRKLCADSGQPVPETRGQVMRCIYESLALTYRMSVDGLTDSTGTAYDALHIIGGGTKDTLLSGFTACACNKPVIAGPGEATVLGNIAVQLMAAGEISSIAQAREVIGNSFELKHYEPQDTDAWEEAYGRYKKIVRA